jgi:hypothetical protein
LGYLHVEILIGIAGVVFIAVHLFFFCSAHQASNLSGKNETCNGKIKIFVLRCIIHFPNFC